ncbi:MAG: N-acetylmuramoyl-L-alanine amidase [Candidatus Omnitrophica bacterium]|nr:N-acetylmuramoyl-L-alanine amidase [Candidatus Omnitrophota bacterium]MDE2008737.1 N-acetylmuramoyl-L-alanine amidase [Candidatus Omnitrophota bacterium]MDE2215161.1 N-acetylmuramoyl-L-alanine amidase [Candidatus Omnitrophota bacterium]MDE2232164.1 N-acetylmuramoyl-L-alanine amidase [Candidatus Omnitrophota bacterium]
MMPRLLAFILVVLALNGCAGGPVIAPTAPMGVPLPDLCQRYHVSWQWDPIAQEVMMEYKGNKSMAMVGSSTVIVGQKQIVLSAPLTRVNSTIYVPEDFEAKVLAPYGVPLMGLPMVESSSWVHTVVLDPGHGGKDTGTRSWSRDVDEKTIVLDVGRRLKRLLEDAGIRVIMTRDTDDFISLQERTIMAAKSGADLFISIHANFSRDRAVSGLIVYYLDDITWRELDEEQRRENERTYLESLKAENSPVLRNIVTDMMDTVKDTRTKVLVRAIIREAREAGIRVRGNGMRLCHFFVVRNTLIPAVLVETGFLSNRGDKNKLTSPLYRQKLARVIARGVLDYANE